MLLEELAQLSGRLGGLLQQALVDDVADVRGGEVDAQLGWEAVLELAEDVGLVGLFELLLAGHEQPRLALEPLASSETKDCSSSMRCWSSWMYWLTSSTTMNSVLSGRAALEHVRDRLRRASAADESAARVPARLRTSHRVGVAVRVEGVHDRGEVVLGQCLILDLGPGLAEHSRRPCSRTRSHSPSRSSFSSNSATRGSVQQ